MKKVVAGIMVLMLCVGMSVGCNHAKQNQDTALTVQQEDNIEYEFLEKTVDELLQQALSTKPINYELINSSETFKGVTGNRYKITGDGFDSTIQKEVSINYETKTRKIKSISLDIFLPDNITQELETEGDAEYQFLAFQLVTFIDPNTEKDGFLSDLGLFRTDDRTKTIKHDGISYLCMKQNNYLTLIISAE